MAVDMSAEITDQNEQLDRITLKVSLSLIKSLLHNNFYLCIFQATCNENRVTNANKKAVQLLKN